MRSSDFWIGIKSLYGSQTSPVDLWMQNSVLRSRITLVSCSQSFICGFVHSKQHLISIRITSLYWVPALICGFCMQNSDFSTRITSLYGSLTSPIVFCIQNSDFSTRIVRLYGSQPSSEVYACKTTTFGSELQSLYGSQTSPVELWMQNSALRSRMTFVYCSQPSSVALCIQNRSLVSELPVSMSPRPHLSFCACKTSVIIIRITSLYGS